MRIIELGSFLLRRPITLADGLRAGGDNYLLLRHVAAILLIYSHSYALAFTGAGHSDFVARLLPGFDGGRVAVLLFFAISGFLVTNSYLRRQELWRFVSARLLRIYPAYVVCLALTLVAVGLGFTGLPRRDYFTDPDTWRYLLHNLWLTSVIYTLPDAFAASPAYPGVVNGSLWSLALEARLYFYLIVLALLGILRRRSLAVVLLLIFIAGTLCFWFSLAPDLEGKRALTLVFAASAVAACAAAYVPVSTRLFLFLIALIWVLRDSRFAFALTIVGIAYFTFWFAYRVPALPVRIPGDYSYGLFLYGFPVQQAWATLYPSLLPDTLTLVALPTTLAIAILSWHWVERRALNMKNAAAVSIAAKK